jgi:N-acetylneuraminate synthase
LDKDKCGFNYPNKIMVSFYLGKHRLSLNDNTFFIAEIGSNFDGDLNRAIDLIYLAKKCGADAVKFQHYTAESLVSDLGFKNLGGSFSHQKNWDDSVFKIYEKASLNVSWTEKLYNASKDAGLIFFTSPYSMNLIDIVDPYLEAYKLGSGDITWIEIAEYMAKKGKPLLIATGASNFNDVKRVYDSCYKINQKIVLMQCNTNYTIDRRNFKYINLNVLNLFKKEFPHAILGLSDHTPGHETVLGAVTLGARVIEKHFTDDKTRKGPDHTFAMDPKDWRQMVEATRNLEMSLGDGTKRVEKNEEETIILQRRSICARKKIEFNSIINEDDLDYLRPFPEGAFAPYQSDEIIGRKANNEIEKGTIILKSMLQ